MILEYSIDMASVEIEALMATIAQNAALYRPEQFAQRAGALQELEYDVIDRLDSLLAQQERADLLFLRRRAEALMQGLVAVDGALFAWLREEIRGGAYRGEALYRLVEEYAGAGPTSYTYDERDLFVRGLLQTAPPPVETRALEPEMVRYQPTPISVVLALIVWARPGPGDVFYDLGSGLGHIPLLVSLASKAVAKGVEYEPAFCDYARQCALDLNLHQAVFINEDARAVDYSDGTIFFLYTPFIGSMLNAVLERLRIVAECSSIRLFTYGPCTAQVAQQSWLECHGSANDPNALALFTPG
jgi:hypothetical protein